MISIHIVSYNKTPYLINAVQSILCQKLGFGKYEILILEGGYDKLNISSRLNVEAFNVYLGNLLGIEKASIKYCFLHGNLGLAGGLNYLHSIQNDSTRYVVEMNEDMFFAPNAIKNMVDALQENPSIGLACANLINGGLYNRKDPKVEDLYNLTNRYKDNEPLKINIGGSNLPYALTEEFYRDLRGFDIWKDRKLPFNIYDGIWDESIDPYGVGWHADWDIYQRVKGVGKETAIIENAHAYHYDHCSGEELDKSTQGWVNVSRENYRMKYGTFDKDFCLIKKDLPQQYPIQRI